MKSFPLDHKKVSNEHYMTLIFLVLVLYLLPSWIKRPQGLMTFIGMVTFALIIDLVANMIRLRSIKCGVSAAITAGIIVLFYPNISLSLGLLSLGLALIVFKYATGSTGQNIFNPAVIGILFLSLLGQKSMVIHHPISYMAMALMMPFMIFRPYAALGLILGFTLSFQISGLLSLEAFFSSGLIVWSALIITDPVTVSSKASLGILAIILAYLVSFKGIQALCVMILTVNLLSYLVDLKYPSISKFQVKKTHLKSPYRKLNGLNKTPCQVQAVKTDKILQKIQDSQIKGLGGSGFSSYDKIMSFMLAPNSKKWMIVNGAECDPGLIHDKWLLNNFKKEIRLGMDLLKKCTGGSHIILACKESHHYAHEVIVEDIYPIGEERQLIKTLLGIELTSSQVPSEYGILVLNVQTVLSIYKAVYCNTKAIKKYITLGNLYTKEASVVEVTLRQPISDYIDEQYASSPLFTGGIMQARPVSSDDLVDNQLNFIGIGPYPHYKNSFCSSCGSCDKYCPVRLPVRRITSLLEKGLVNKAENYKLKACISCGLCSYHCLAGKDITSLIRSYK